MHLRTISNLARFKDIVLTLLNYGFEDLVGRLDLPGKSLVEKIHKKGRGLNTYERIRCAIEDLGPTFIKFGQIISTRPDLLPQPLIVELRKLQDEVAEVDFPDIRDVVTKSLGQPFEDVFAAFDQKPVAAASLSQVHRAVLRENEQVVAAKVQRPGIRRKIESDLDIMATVADRLNDRIAEVKIYDLPNLVSVVKRTLLRELDFRREARYMRIARAHLVDKSEVYVPEVYTRYCTERLLVMEFIEGTKLKDLKPEILTDAERLAKNALKSAIQQILEDGFFHADPHPGNILVKDGNLLTLIDWGMVGRLTQEDRFELIDLIKAVVDKDSRKLTDALLMITRYEHDVDRRSLERELLDILDSQFAIPLKDIPLGNLLLDITGVLRQYRLRLPPDLAIMIKALITAEGTARQLYPDLDVVSEAKPHIERLASQRFSPAVLWRGFRYAVSQLLASQGRLPGRISQIVNKIERGQLSIRFEHENLGDLRKTLDKTFNRLTFGIIIAALIIGSSMVITTGVKPLLMGFPALGLAGYIISGVLGLWLVFDIIRGRRF